MHATAISAWTYCSSSLSACFIRSFTYHVCKPVEFCNEGQQNKLWLRLHTSIFLSSDISLKHMSKKCSLWALT